MGSALVTQDWELIVSSDLASSLIPNGQLRRLQRPVDDRMLSARAYRALADRVGPPDLEDMLLVPAVLRPVGHRWQHRRLYAPLCVLGMGERGLGLWVESPSPGVQAALPFADITAVERRAEGSWRRLSVTGRDTAFSVWYTADGDPSADIWTERLRGRAASQSAADPRTADSGEKGEQ
ncbi:MAG TPA: hypothetical protein VGG75_09540 [Trebonia sp.]|jgi:hypothetical protein